MFCKVYFYVDTCKTILPNKLTDTVAGASLRLFKYVIYDKRLSQDSIVYYITYN